MNFIKKTSLLLFACILFFTFESDACYFPAAQQQNRINGINLCNNWNGIYRLEFIRPNLYHWSCFANANDVFPMVHGTFNSTCPIDPPAPPVDVARPPNTPTTNQCGSIVHPESRVVKENVPIAGTPFFLNYSSSRAVGFSGYRVQSVSAFPNTFCYSIPAGGVACPDLTATVTMGDVTYQETIPNGTITKLFEWNGLNAAGDLVLGSVIFTVTFGESPNAYPNDAPIFYSKPIGSFYAFAFGLGGWTISPVHFYDKNLKTVFLGDGGSYAADAIVLAGPNYQVASHDGTEVYIFDSTGRHVQTKTGVKGTTKYTFTYVAGKLSTLTDAYANTTTINYTSGKPSSIVGPYGHTTTIGTNTDGYITSVTNPLSETYLMTYHSGQLLVGLLQTFQNPKGVTSSMAYTGYGHLSLDQSSAGSSLALSSAGAYLPVESTTAEGVVANHYTTLTQYSTTRKTVGPGYLESKEVFNYNPDGSVGHIVATDTLGFQTELNRAYDPRLTKLTYTNYLKEKSGAIERTTNSSRAATVSTPSNPFSVVDLTYNSVLNSTKTTSVSYLASTSTYTRTSPVGRKHYVTVDSYERPTSIQFATTTPVTLTYDTRGRVQTATQGTSRTLTLGYDSNGYLQTLTNALSQTKTFGYDGIGRLISETLPDSRVIGYTYDSNGNLASVTPPGGVAHTFLSNGFDLLERYTAPVVTFFGFRADVAKIRSETKSVISKWTRDFANWLKGFFPTAAKTFTMLMVGTQTEYDYNDDRQLTSITRPDGGSATFNYNTHGRLTSISTTTGNFTVNQNTYLERLDSIVSPDSTTQTYSYNGPFLLSSVNSGAVSGSVYFTYNNEFQVATTKVNTATALSYAYDNDGLITTAGAETITRNSTTGFATSATVGSVSENYTYSASYGELASIQGKYSTSTNVYNEVLTRDDLGRVTTKAETVGSGGTDTYSYTFDAAGRLTTVLKNSAAYSSYTYDSNSNRLSVTRGGVTTSAAYDEQDRLVTFGTKTYSHNDAGERTGVSDSSVSPAAVTSYTYDVFGNLKSVTLPSGGTISYVLDGWGRRSGRKVAGVMERQFVWFDAIRPAGELNASGVLVSQFIYGLKGNVPDYIIKGGVNYKVMTDHLGSVVAVVDSATGTVAQAISYDEFGRVLSDTSPGFQPFGFAGGLYDWDTKLVLFGARSYDAETGRWLSKDPILFAGSDTNLYGYVMNDPVNFVDPVGRAAMAPGDGGPGLQNAEGTRLLINSYRRDGGSASDIASVIKGDRQSGVATGRAAANAEHYFLAKYLTTTGWAPFVPVMIPIYSGGKALDQFLGTNIFSNPDATPASIEQMSWGYRGAYDDCP